MENNTLFLQAFNWEIVDEAGENGSVAIHCWALDRESKTHLLRIEDYNTTCFVELPSIIEGMNVEWFDRDVDAFVSSLMGKLGNSSPVDYKFLYRHRLYYYNKRKFPMVQLSFRTLAALNECNRLLSRPYFFKGKGRAKAMVWENKIPLLRKFLTKVKLASTQWFEVKAEKMTGDRKISKLETEYLASWRKVAPLDKEKTNGWMTHPKILVFDIEAYSKNHKAFPYKHSATDACFIISAIVQQLGKKETRKEYAIVYGDCHDIEGVTVIRVNSEIECIKRYAQLVNEVDPDIISGYNHHGFDNDYMNARLERVMEEWPDMSRLLGDKVEMDTRSWSSAAYGHNEVNIIKMGGRISIDMMLIKRDYKLPRYDLSTVGMFFVGRAKHDVKPVDLFIAFENYWKAKKAYDLDQSEENKEALEVATTELTRMVRYCTEDGRITLDVNEKIFWWFASLELSGIVGTTIMDLYTRGQQVRCLSKIYDEAHQQGYVIDFHEPLNVIFNGGAVQKPLQGVHDEVPCYDFNSLYPSIIIEDNIDYTTFVPDWDKSIPDEDCNIIEFDQLERPKKVNDKVHDEDFDADAEIDDKDGKMVHRRIRFVKEHIRKGIVPTIVKFLIDERNKVKAQLKPLEAAKRQGLPYDAVLFAVLDKRQWALKITANSFFGFMGAYIGKLPLIEAAMAVTAKGRKMIGMVRDHLVEKHQAIVVYGDTDSVMPKFIHLDGKPWKEKYAFWKSQEKELSGLFHSPTIKIEMEKVMRGIFFAPKMYAYLGYDQDGNLPTTPKDITAKGIILARRDGTPWVRGSYRNILFSILINYSPIFAEQLVSMESSFGMIVDSALDLLENRVDWQDLAKINELGASYKNPNYQMNVFAQHLAGVGRPAQPGDRLRYVICDVPGEKAIGKKMRSDDEYLESQETDNPLKLDVNYYLENALQKKVDPLFSVAFNMILPGMTDIGYKPASRKHFVPIGEPVRMLARAIEDGNDIKELKGWFREHVDKLRLAPPPSPKKILIRRNSTAQITKPEIRNNILVLE